MYDVLRLSLGMLAVCGALAFGAYRAKEEFNTCWGLLKERAGMHIQLSGVLLGKGGEAHAGNLNWSFGQPVPGPQETNTPGH